MFKGVVGGYWVYKLRGSAAGAPERYRGQLHYGGHRYLQLTSDRDVVIHSANNVAVSSVGAETIQFESSDPIIDRFVENVKWSQASNFISVPTDCPTREYRGWNGDANVFAETSVYTFDSTQIYSHFIRLLQEYSVKGIVEQGRYGNHHPTENANDGNANGDGWCDVGVTLPWQYYMQTGDVSILEYSWDGMTLFMDLINSGTDFSDPLADTFKYGYTDIGLSDHNNKDQAPTKTFLAVAYTYYDNLIMSKMAAAAGDAAKAAEYGAMAAAGRRFMIDRYLDADGNVLCATRDMANEGDSMYNRIDNAQTAISWMLLLDIYDTDRQFEGLSENLATKADMSSASGRQ